MNILPLLAVFLFNSQTQFVDRDINHEIASSLLFVIENFFTHQSSSFVFILSCQRQHTMNFYKDLMEVLFGYWGNIKAQVIINSETAPAENFCNLVLIDSAESFVKLNLASKVESYDTNEYYHIFLQNRDKFLTDDIQRILDYCWLHYIINVNIQVQWGSGEIVVYSYFPFTASHCGRVVPVEVNRFYNGSMKNANLFPPKVANMHNCVVKVATWLVPPFMMLESQNPGSTDVRGFEGEILLQLSKLMNFRIEIVVPPNNEQRGIITGNDSTGAISMLRRREADLSLGYFWFTSYRARLVTATDSHFQSVNVAVLMAVSTNYELLQNNWFPYKPEASCALLTAFLISLGLFFVITKRQQLSEFLCDVPYRNITLNHVANTLGFSSWINPKHNWARIFVMTWTMYSLIIRTNYGAILFHIMKNNLFRKTPSTLQDCVRLNYTIALEAAAYAGFRYTSVFTETGLKALLVDTGASTQGRGVLFYLEEHSNERLLNISPLEIILMHLSESKKPGLFKVMKESLIVQNCCMYLTKHSFLVDQVNFLLQRITAVGLFDAWKKKYFDMSFLQEKTTPVSVTVGFEELKGVYLLCAMMLAGSFFVFCLEILSARIRFLRIMFEKL